MNRFLRAAGENGGGLLMDCRELSPNHTSSSSSSSISITSSSSSSSSSSSADRHAALPSLQTRGPGSGGSEPRRSGLKRSRAGREGREEPAAAAEHHSAAAAGGEVRVAKQQPRVAKQQQHQHQQQQQQRLEAQGRSIGGEGLEMISASSRDVDGGGGSGCSSIIINNNTVVSEVVASPASCTKGKEERKGKNVIRGWKRDRDRDRDAAASSNRTRKEKPPGDGASPPPPPPPLPPSSVFLPSSALLLPEHHHHLCRDGHCHCAAPDSRITGDNGGINNVNNNNNNAAGCGVKSCSGGGGAIVVRRQHDDTPAAKKHRGAEKVDPMFTVPAPPAPGHPGAPGSSLPSAPSFSPPALPTSNPKQLAVRTRSIGTNTQDGGVSGALEGDSACLGPCQPGTSVNLEGIVWHETDEGVLVVNVTWRKRTYVGTLLDCTKHDWAPPRFCESPSSDPELPGGRGRGKRMRMAMAERPCVEPAPAAKVRGLSQHRSRGGGVAGTTANIHSKGRRGSLNLINCRTPPSFFTVEEVKPANSTSSLSSGKRKSKPPADLDLSMVSSDDIKNGNGKRIRAKSRSAPSTPQGKSDPSFMDPGGGCASSPPPPPILIDCPHPNCTKRYKHINGLRYHQTHAHLEAEEQRKPELEPMKDGESEERLSDCEDAISSLTYDLSETNSTNSSSKKPAPLYKVTTVGSPKNRRLLLSTDHSPSANPKTRRTSLLKDGLIDDLSNLPIISNMTVVLENCMVPDRNSTVEMPKLEAEGLIDKKGGPCDKGKKANGKVEKLSKSRTNRPIAPAPAPPKLIAIPNTAYPSGTADTAASQQPSPMAAVGLTSKNLPLKPIKPKLSIVVEPSLVKATLVTCSKETRKKEKRRLKDKHNKDAQTRTPNGDSGGIKMEDGVGGGGGGCGGGGGGSKMGVKEISGSLLKEHLSKQDVMNGLTESQESRMASIRAEADKVYTFTDNAPSPSIGGSSRLDSAGGCLATDSKNNSPAYSDISDAGDDGGSSECRSDGIRSKSASSVSSEVSSNSSHGSSGKTPPTASAPPSKDPQSPYYHGYEPYYLQGYMQSDRQTSSGVAFHKSSGVDGKGKDRKEDAKEDEKSSSHEYSDSKKGDGPPQSQLQLAMSQTQTALAQSLYYGQYSRGLYMDQKMLLASKCCDQTHGAKQRGERGQGARDGEDDKHVVTAGGLGKGPDGAKGCCPKPVLSYVEMSERGERGLGVKAVHGGGIIADQHQVSMKDCDDIKSPSSSSSSSLHNPNSQTDLDSNVSYSSPSDGPSWAHCLAHSKYSELQHGEEAEEGEADRGKEWGATVEPAGAKMTSGGGGDKKARVHDLPPAIAIAIDVEESDGLDGLDDQGQEPMGGLAEESQSARAAVSPPMTPQQPYIQYQHSSYPPYLAMCESGGGSYRGVSPTLVHNYPGFHYPLYGKTAGREESEVTPPGRGGAVSGKQSGDSSSSSAMELLQQQSHQYHGKSPAPGEKGSPEGERETERERNHLSFARHLHTHHHTHLGMSYNLMSGQYDIYQGLSSRSLVSSQQVSGHSSTENEGKK
ncbi:LOW QUALITY PROTEIN: zinc finger protein 608 [Sebastes umbrosus]|uniref:LOW QUALITY PROTEIN: zinc finger protein 608 n=1 Tax=Sebastes umbrosus TaxID=72105 RepID=UPI00189D07F4|nr:LOW QUALITY PROTEIN: zinc finger protein 608 [Sebastes umbrosus]